VWARGKSHFENAFALIWSKSNRLAVRDFYAFCRLVDDIADESSFDAKARMIALSEIEDWILTRPALGHPYWDRLKQQVDENRIPSYVLLGVTQGVSQDLKKSPLTFQSWGELENYIFQVAGCVGLGVLSIFGTHGEQAQQYAIQLGRFVQYINIMRDLEEDLAQNKIFIPESFLREKNIDVSSPTPHDLAFCREELLSRAMHARTQALPFHRSCFIPEIMASVYRESALKYWRYGFRQRLSKAEKTATTVQTTLQFWLNRKSLSAQQSF
jgi:phytoene/squalene synthetase